VELVKHDTDEILKRYAMQTLPEPEAGPSEEHLLICHDFRDRLKATDEYVAAMKAVAYGVK
jgi:hypothetical protein